MRDRNRKEASVMDPDDDEEAGEEPPGAFGWD